MSDNPLHVGEIGVLQHMNRPALNGLIAEVTGRLKKRALYSITNPADSEICMAYKVCIPGFPPIHARIEWCVKSHQLRRIDTGNGLQALEETGSVGSSGLRAVIKE